MENITDIVRDLAIIARQDELLQLNATTISGLQQHGDHNVIVQSIATLLGFTLTSFRLP